jgi:two-component system, LuxR family, sensor kinase FixL
MSTVQDVEKLKKEIAHLSREAGRCQLAEKRLRESEEKYSTLVENSLTGIYVDQDGTIVFANERFAQIYGYRLEEVLGIESRRLVHPEDRDMTDAIRTKRLEGKDVPTEYNARGIKKDGETIWVSRRNTRIFFQGQPAILGNIVDITQEQQLKEELRRANQEHQAFVDMVSHDLKTPTIAIQGFVGRLFKHCRGEMDDKAKGYLDQIKHSAERIEALVSDLLDLARSGKVVSEYEKVSSKDIVQTVMTTLEEQMPETHAEFVVSEDLPVILADKEAINRVFQNLLGNAIKYSMETGKPKIEVGCQDRGQFYCFFVKDDGPGIDPKHHQAIFQMFQRSEESTGKSKARKGTGLGLAIVKRIICAHGGTIWVESEKDQGATFYFTLPKEPDAL